MTLSEETGDSQPHQTARKYFLITHMRHNTSAFLLTECSRIKYFSRSQWVQRASTKGGTVMGEAAPGGGWEQAMLCVTRPELLS